MALAVKAIPTLYGDEAREFQYRADEVERRFMEQPRPAVYFVYVYYVIILCAAMIEYKELSVRYKHFYIEEKMESCPFCTRPHIKFGVLNSKRDFVESKSAEPTTNDTPYMCPVCEHPFYYHQSKVDDSHVVYMYLQIASDISWNYYCMAIDTKSNKAVSSILLNRKHYDKPCPDDLVKYVMSHRDELLSYTNTDSEQRLWDDVIYGFRFYYGNMHNRIYVNTRYLANHPILKCIVDRLEFLPAFNTIYI